jgi:predicted transcriptional regulator
MAETNDSLENLAYIRTHVDNLERLVRFQVSADPASREAIRERFRQREGMAEVYLALGEGPKTQDELSTAVKRSVPTISKILRQLADEGMVAKMPSPNNPKRMVYLWTDLEEMLKVSKIASEFVTTDPSLKAVKSDVTQYRAENVQADDDEGQR